jgi:hypothetical protein
MKFSRIVRIARTSARIVRSAASVPCSTLDPRSTSRTHSDKVSPRLQHPQPRLGDFGPDRFAPQRQAAKGKLSARFIDGESAHRVHLMLRAASQGHVLTVRRFFFRRSLFDLSYRTATEVTLQLPSGGDVSPPSRRRRRRALHCQRATAVYRCKHAKAAPKSGLPITAVALWNLVDGQLRVQKDS